MIRTPIRKPGSPRDAGSASRRNDPSSAGDRADLLPSTTGSEAEGLTRPPFVLTHEWIWGAIDALAARHGLTASGLARRAGLDPTTFNKSKRKTGEGRPRWPTTESLSKVLVATGTTLDEFASIEVGFDISPTEAPERTLSVVSSEPRDVPLLGHVRNGVVDDWPTGLEPGRSQSGEGGEVGAEVFALDVADNSLEPVYSRGHTLIVSAAEPARPGDRVVVKPTGSEPLPRLLIAADEERVHLAIFGSVRKRIGIERSSIEWIARIVSSRY